MPETIIPNLTNGQLYGFRMFPRNMKNQFQTEIDMGTAEATPKDWEVVYHGTTTALQISVEQLGAASIGDYALFADGGRGKYVDSESSYVTAYNSSLTRLAAPNSSFGRWGLSGASNRSFAVFGPGKYEASDESTYESPVCDAYNSSLTKLTINESGYYPGGIFNYGAATVNEYILFAGSGAGSSYSSIVWSIDPSLTRYVGQVTDLSVARSWLAGASLGNYALFAGGWNRGSYNTVDAYDVSLTRTNPTGLSISRSLLTGTVVGNYALFGGGADQANASALFSTVDVYNKSLTRTTTTDLSVARCDLSSVTLGNFGIFGYGGNRGSSSSSLYSNAIDVYDISLTKTKSFVAGTGRCKLGAAVTGNYALFAGGNRYIRDNVRQTEVVDVFALQ